MITNSQTTGIIYNQPTSLARLPLPYCCVSRPPRYSLFLFTPTLGIVPACDTSYIFIASQNTFKSSSVTRREGRGGTGSVPCPTIFFHVACRIQLLLVNMHQRAIIYKSNNIYAIQRENIAYHFCFPSFLVNRFKYINL